MEAVELAGAVDFRAFRRRERHAHVGRVTCPLVSYVDDLKQALARRAALRGVIDGDLNGLRVRAGWQPQKGAADYHRASEKPN